MTLSRVKLGREVTFYEILAGAVSMEDFNLE